MFTRLITAKDDDGAPMHTHEDVKRMMMGIGHRQLNAAMTAAYAAGCPRRPRGKRPRMRMVLSDEQTDIFHEMNDAQTEDGDYKYTQVDIMRVLGKADCRYPDACDAAGVDPRVELTPEQRALVREMHAAKTDEGGPAHDRGNIMKAVGRHYKHYIAVLAAAGVLPRRPVREPGVFSEEE
eukprot:800978-Pyramimonas_sp.AAC.1